MPADRGHAACHLCRVGQVEAFPEYRALPRVSSDAKPFPAGGELGVCARCGAVQKPLTAAWQADVDAIYRAYTIYHNAAGTEQTVFAGGGGVPAARSSRVIREARSRVEFPQSGRMLDVGCGNGAMLRAFAGEMPGWTLAGNELTDHHRTAVEAIPGVEKLYLGRATDAPGTFDLITLMHVLEHVPDPIAFVRDLAKKLTPEGMLLIEVPDHRNNPFDLMVADHCTHFAPETLRSVLEAAGLEVLALADDIIPRELTLVAKVGASHVIPPVADAGPVKTAVAGQLQWLAGLAEQGRSLGNGRIGVFGTSIGAAWLLGVAGDRVGFFLDEDAAKVGQTWDGRPILRPADAPGDCPVLIGLPPRLAAEIKARLDGVIGAARVHIPRAA